MGIAGFYQSILTILTKIAERRRGGVKSCNNGDWWVIVHYLGLVGAIGIANGIGSSREGAG